ncbi:hypothetical protein AAHE18_03G008000 [Arachis hypogaea]
MASEEDKALPLVNTDDDPDSHMIIKMATVEYEISEKEKEEIRLLYERAERRRGPAISYFPRRRKPAQKQRGLFEPNKGKMKFSTLLVEKQNLHPMCRNYDQN